MEGTEIVLAQMLACRESRSMMQLALIREYSRPVISYCMNIPGPIKTNDQICAAFTEGKERLLQELHTAGIPILFEKEIHVPTGDEMMIVPDSDAETIKNITTSLEETMRFGRLYDMDVIGTDGEKLSRPSYRKCLICDRQAQECARTRAHSVQDMQDAIDRLLSTF